MFNNRFNSTNKDPLVEAVRQAQQDGDLRRQAEAIVNEEFGVYSRQAVVRENLAAYDARLEEAYKCMKEGNPLDPVGKEDGDVDNDGDSDKSDKYLLNRRKAIGKAMGKRMEEESDGLPPSAAAKQAAKQTSTPASTPAPTKTKDLSSTFSSARGAAGMNEGTMTGIKLKANKGEEGLDVMYKSPRMKKAEKLHTINKAHRGRWGTDDAPGIGSKASAIDSVRTDAAYLKARKRAEKRGYDMKRYDEETIEEAVSRKHFQQVADLIKGHESQEKRNELASHHAGIFSKQNPRFDHGRFHKAAGSTAHEAPKKMEEAAYSAKAARAGKDIGKPGKMFAQIAAKAGEKYGSEERGKKVAGAILKKIRAKHVKEDQGF